MIPTYRVRLILRPGNGEGPDQEAELTAHARGEEQARRLCMEHVWERGWIVGRFASIKQLRKPKRGPRL